MFYRTPDEFNVERDTSGLGRPAVRTLSSGRGATLSIKGEPRVRNMLIPLLWLRQVQKRFPYTNRVKHGLMITSCAVELSDANWQKNFFGYSITQRAKCRIHLFLYSSEVVSNRAYSINHVSESQDSSRLTPKRKSIYAVESMLIRRTDPQHLWLKAFILTTSTRPKNKVAQKTWRLPKPERPQPLSTIVYCRFIFLCFDTKPSQNDV